ncbi:hypothetical protein [Burkholderia ambifaria]|uniref:Uncharacterized protein n=1 Tax=Burkholderia ambifaria TaxID=152480 RepID=A0AA41E3J9_9BURK|nr:hypothetical protein [Burkholderia ambifaria]MBR8127796.1 hypothetical protein [Burkholderia ambifaria]PRD94654.1 hypothetical protein C6P77_29010 [Burkholderia ambifaria]
MLLAAHGKGASMIGDVNRPDGGDLVPERICVGVGVTREIIEVCVSSMRLVFGYRNETFGIESLTDAIAEWSPALVVVESAGGYECEAACALQAARLPVAVVHLHQARAFIARSLDLPLEGKGAHARMMTELACMLDAAPSSARFAEPLADPQLQHVQALVQRRRQLARTLMAEYQLLARCHPSVRVGIEQTIAFLGNQIDVVERHCGWQVRGQRVGTARALARAVRRSGRAARLSGRGACG